MKVHFLGIGGVGMAGLALLMKDAGHEVSGCDVAPSARLKWLEANEIKVFIGHSAGHAEDADELVYTPAIDSANAELAAARHRSTRGEVLASLVRARPSIAVCGSHGKTTTATFTAKLLKALGDDPAWAIGGETGEFPVAGTGKGPLVVEADESDGTLALYRPKILVVTNCEYDHPDHFKTPDEYVACFDTARRNAGEVIESEELELDGWEIPLAELHNRRNARAAIEVALRLGHTKAEVMAALPGAVAQLPDRRFQPAGEGVYTDYAHHPTEMRIAVGMARARCRGTLRVLFQPHRYSRTRALLHDFPAAFAGADEVVLCPTYAAFEQPVPGGDIADLYRELREHGGAWRLYLARSCREAWTHACLDWRPGDLTLVLGAGDIVKVLGTPPDPEVRIPLGMGSNTWRSDLNTNEKYFAVDGPAGMPGAKLHIPWMAGIPGTVGGWIKMNAGAHGHAIGELVEEVKVDGKWVKPVFGYRTSDIEGVIEDFRLKPFAADPAAEQAFLAKRRRFPARTKGSVFKNPPGDFAGRLLEAAGAKALKVGSASVWQEHANVIIAGEDGNQSDFLALGRLMQLAVWYRFGIRLEAEVKGISLDK